MYRDLILLGFTPLILQACTPTEAQLLNCGESDCMENRPFVVLGSFSDSSDGKSQMSPALMQVSPLASRPTLEFNTIFKSSRVFQCRCIAVMMQHFGFGKQDNMCFFSPPTSPLPFLQKSKIHTWIHTGYLSTLGWRFNREFWNSPSGFLWKNFNGESSCAWSIWWESVTLRCQTSQACSARYNICSTSRLWMAFQYGRKGQGEGTHNRAKPQLQGHITSHRVYLTDSIFLYVPRRCSSTVI